MKKQTGARYLHKAKNRTDQSFNGLIKVANPSRIVRMASGAVKRVKS